MKPAILLGIVLGVTAICESASAEAPSPRYGQLPSGAPTFVPSKRAPHTVPRGATTPGLFFGKPMPGNANVIDVTGIASRPTDRGPTAEETETCFAEMTSEVLDSARANHADHPTEWGDSGLSAQVQLYRRSADYPQGGVSAVHLERFEEKNGTPTLEMTDAWADPATRGARVFAQKSVPLALVATSAFGVRVFAVRDDHAKDKVVQFVVVPDATQRGAGQSSMIGMASDGQTTARSQCGHLRIALPVTDEGASAQLFVSVIVGETKSDPKVTVSGASELRSKRRRHREGAGIPKFRALATQVSVSKTSRDPEPIVSVSFGWAARESTERLF